MCQFARKSHGDQATLNHRSNQKTRESDVFEKKPQQQNKPKHKNTACWLLVANATQSNAKH